MDIRKKIGGAFALVFLFGDGIGAFSGTRRAALQSFLIPLCLLPFGLWTAAVFPPLGMEKGFSSADIMAATAAQALLSLALSVLLAFVVGKAFDRLSAVWLFLEACNWVSLVLTALGLPFLLVAAKQWVARGELDRISILATVYYAIVTACVANRCFRLNWQLAGAIACFLLVADQESWAAVYRIWHIPYLRDL